MMRRLVALLGYRWFGAVRDAGFVFAATLAILLVSDGYPGWEAPLLALINASLVVGWGLTVDLYDTSHPRVATPPVGRIVRAMLWVLLTYLAVHFVTDSEPQRRTVVFAMGAAAAAMATGYALRVAALLWFQSRGLLRERILLVGGDEQGLSVAEQIGRENRAAVHLVGALDEFSPRSSRLGPVEVLGDPLELSAVVDRTGATAVVVIANAISWEAQEHVMRVAADRPGLRVFMVAGVSDLLSSEVLSARDGLPPLVRLRPAQLRRSDAIIKRTLDLGVGVALLPLMCAVLLWARLAGGRPLTRAVDVLGRDGSVVRMRLLEPGRPGSLRGRLAGGRAGKLPALPRVLAGQLSLVGPRPIVASSAAAGDSWQRRLLLMAPGLTGPWDRGGTTSESVLDDLTYIRTYTPWSDVRLLLGSLGRLMTRQTAVPPVRDLQVEGRREAAGAAERPAAP